MGNTDIATLEEIALRVFSLIFAAWAAGVFCAAVVGKTKQYLQASLTFLLGALMWILELVGNAIHTVLTIAAKTVEKLWP